jgi:hypothetical protein
MTEPHACFHLGVVAGLGIALVVTALFGWAFIALVESDWSGGGRTDR